MRLRVTNTGLRLLTLSTVQSPQTLPTCDDGTTARHMRIAVEPGPGTVAFAYVHLSTTSSATVGPTDLMVSQYEHVILDTRGFTNIKTLGGTGVTTVYVNVVPLENG